MPQPGIALRLAALLLTALALVPVGAHLLALPNKIGLPAADYLVAQGLYRGWALLGLVLAGAILADGALALALRRHGGPWRAAVAGTALMALTLALFLAFTFPANRATGNWTRLPEGWEALRLQWEASHAANAVLTFLALACIARAAIGDAARRR